MRRDSRLSVALHVLLHMSELAREGAGVITSEALAPMMKMNAVVLRRTLAGLRDAGILRAEKGHGGGWSLARALESVSLGEVYDALGAPAPFAMGPRIEKPRCGLEQAVNRAIGDAQVEAEALLSARLRAVSVADLVGSARAGRHAPRKGGT